jgi:hypothetical protein
MVKEALKFFQNWIKTCIEVGGENLPRAISTNLGAKLAKLYKNRGITDITPSLRQMYLVLRASPTIDKVDENTYRAIIKYPRKFCPIGGKYSLVNAPIFQNNICLPQLMGFLNSLNSDFIYEIVIEECIVASNKRTCQYCLKLKKKY